jgi:phosphate transport system substrate-binding protein
LSLAAALLTGSGCSPADTTTIQGCGATFPAPLYKRWFLEFYQLHPNVRVNYQAIGSGAGVQQFEEGLVHFGATDEALREARLKEIAKKLSERERQPVQLLQIPLTSGSVAICYHLPGGPRLKLTRWAYIGMLLGETQYWDDPVLQSPNPELTLPHIPITFVRRADSSGTTFVFTKHLAAADPRWAKESGGPGAGKSVPWRVGIGGKGNAGVAALIQQTPGAFGYVESGYAELIGLPIASLENRAGKFVMPTAAHCREALQEAKFDKVLGATVPDPSGDDAYPIVSMTWIICRTAYPDPIMAQQLKTVVFSCLDAKGQHVAEDLQYIPLPNAAIARAREVASHIQTQ